MGTDGLVVNNQYLEKATIIDYKRQQATYEIEVVG